MGRELLLPEHAMYCNAQGDLFALDDFQSKYKILCYNDTAGCTRCKLNIPQWKSFVDDLAGTDLDVSVILCFSTTDIDGVRAQLQECGYDNPVCFDTLDILGKSNCFPNGEAYRTFLLGEKNEVIAIGNPISNYDVKKLYLYLIGADTEHVSRNESGINTEVEIQFPVISLGRFQVAEEQKAVFTLKNVGDYPFEIQEVLTSCDCLEIRYSREPLPMGSEMPIEVIYRPKQTGHLRKTVLLRCNVKSNIVKLVLIGEAL